MKLHLFAVSLLALLAGASAAGEPMATTVADRAAYFPVRKQVPLPGKIAGILLADAAPVLANEGRSGPPDQLVFSSGGNSYRWVYVPTMAKPLITNLQVPAGAKGQIKQVYPALNMANMPSVAQWQIVKPYTLVEIEINQGQGSPKYDSFVATSMRVIEGTRDLPLKAADAVKGAKDRYAAYIAKKQGAIDKGMRDAAEKALKGKPATGPRERADLMYVTWIPASSTMRMAFKTTISDGAYEYIGGGVLPKRLPPGKPLPRGMLQIAPPPKDFAVKIGTTFGIEFGQAYVVNKDGKWIGTEELPIEMFSRPLNAPVLRRGGL